MRANAMSQRAQPNFLFIMADQLAASALRAYGNRVAKAPHIDALAARGVVFDNAYCNAPICAPSRFSMLSGRLPTAIKAFDNASEFPASIPTLAHYLTSLGYRTILSGKMHFIGPDQQHGFAERLVTDIYPSDFTWTPDWTAGPRDRPSGISMQGVIQAGPCTRTLQMDYDDEVEFQALGKIYDLAREEERKPFLMMVSFSHPHSPFTIHTDYWNRYTDDEIDAPKVAPIPIDKRDTMSRWLALSHLADQQPVSSDQTRAARRAYYGMISYIDDKVGRLLKAIEEAQLADDTVIVFCSDHGEMLGERGMWYKQNFFESSARVPLIICAPGRFAARRSAEIVSLVDLMPTLLDIATDGAPPPTIDPLDGRSLTQIMAGASDPDAFAISEYTDMGVRGPCRMIRKGRYKAIHVYQSPPQLYDVVADPLELTNLHGDPASAAIEQDLLGTLLENWSPDDLYREVVASQQRRLFLKQVALRSGEHPDWSFQAFRDDFKRFVRGSGATGAKARARFPFVPPEGG